MKDIDMKDAHGKTIRAGDRVRCPNGRTGSLVLRGQTLLNTSHLYNDKFTVLDDVDGLLDIILHNDKNGCTDVVRLG